MKPGMIASHYPITVALVLTTVATGYFRDGFSRNPGRGDRHIGFRCARGSK